MLGRGLTTRLVNDGGLTRRGTHLVKCWIVSGQSYTNHDQPVGEGFVPKLYRYLTKEILADLTSQPYNNRKGRYLTS